MRARFALSAGLSLLAPAALGCEGAASLCENHTLRAPYGVTTTELRHPEKTVPIGGEPRIQTVTPTFFDEDAWAASAFDSLPPRAAPELTATVGSGGSLLICTFTAGPSPGIDGIDGPAGPLVSVSTPDLLVWADFAGTKLGKGPKLSSRTGTFAFRTALKQDDPIQFTFGDYDFFSSNDYIGAIQGRYPGKLPFTISGKGGTATCNAASPERLASEAAKQERQLNELLAALEAREPTLEDPLDFALGDRIDAALAAALYFRGDALPLPSLASTTGPLATEAKRRVEEASRNQWRRHTDLLRAKQAALPEPGAWVDVSPRAQARISGLRCEKFPYSTTCHPEVELRLKEGQDALLCPADDDKLGDVGPFRVYRATGGSRRVTAFEVMVQGHWVSDQMELARLPKGTVVSVPLNSDFSRDSQEEWDVPLVRVGAVYLRVY